MSKKIISTILFAIITTLLTAQTFNLSAEIRPRYENKHGYKTLQVTNADGANFISQRTRLNFGYKNEKLSMYVSLQDVRVWGDVGTISNDGTSNALHEAWAEAILSDKVSLKIGRQEITYDDHRIFGSVGWAQKARSHDAFIFKFTPNNKNRIDIGIAINEINEDGVDDLYSIQHKSFQYVWYHTKFNQLGVSFLALNTGYEYIDISSGDQTIDYMQTIGPRITYKKNKINANIATYFQTGKKNDANLSALYYSGNFGYKVNENFTLGIGYEYLSGKNQDDSSADIKSFAPLFGTNHKFNGWMDYFYVGNHGGSVGLSDINVTVAYKKNKFSAKIIPHFFSTAADVYNGSDKMEAKLGTEIDVTFGYKIAKDITLTAGYSQMFATDTMEQLKGGGKDETNSWSWIMFTFKPKFL